jgi:hypothetical protein
LNAYILIQADPRAGADGRLSEEIGRLDGVARVDRVRGPVDLIAQVDAAESAIDVLVSEIRGLSGTLHAVVSPVLDRVAVGAPVTA